MTRDDPRQAVILAAGASTRTYPLTLERPKPLLPLVNKPLLHHTLEQLDGLVDEAILVVGFEREQIMQAIGDTFGGLRIRYCVQEQQLGTGHALLHARPLIRGSFLLLNGDDLVHRHDLERLTEHRYAALGMLVPDPRPYGLLVLDSNNDIERIIEKPTVVNTHPIVNTGMYLLQSEVFHAMDLLGLSERGEYELTDFVRHLPDGARCRAVEVQHYWLSAGYPWTYLEANRVLLERSNPPGPRMDNVSTEGAVLVGTGTVVQDGCHLGPGTTIGRDCRVGAGSNLENCLVMDGVVIGQGCQLRDSIIAWGAELGDRVRTATRAPAGGNVWATVKSSLVDTGRESFGAVIGEKAQIGRGVLLAPGVRIWPDRRVAAGAKVQSDILGGD